MATGMTKTSKEKKPSFGGHTAEQYVISSLLITPPMVTVA
jgi:hypothetical protein